MHAQTVVSSLAAAVLLATGAAAQSTWIVDRLNRPGTQFLDVPAAVAAAAPGDIVRVRYVDPLTNPYTAPTIAKALTLVGDGGLPGFLGTLLIQNVPAGQQVLLSGVQLAPFPGANPAASNCNLVVQNNPGQIHLKNLNRASLPASAAPLNQSRIENCALVTLAACTLEMVGSTGTIVIRNCPLVSLHECVLQHAASTPAPTLLIDSSDVTIADSLVIGSGQSPSAFAIALQNATVRCAGNGTSVMSSTGGTAIGSIALGGTVAVGSSAFVGQLSGVTLVQQPVPALGASIDGNHLFRMTMFGETLGVGVVAVGPTIPTGVPLFGGTLFVDPFVSGVVDVVAFNLTGRGQWQLQLPASLPPGFAAWLQGVTLGLASGFLLTPPTLATVP